MTSRQYFRDARGRFASPARFEWQMLETGAFRPHLSVEPSRPDIPTLTDEVSDTGYLWPKLSFWRWLFR